MGEMSYQIVGQVESGEGDQTGQTLDKNYKRKKVFIIHREILYPIVMKVEALQLH